MMGDASEDIMMSWDMVWYEVQLKSVKTIAAEY